MGSNSTATTHPRTPLLFYGDHVQAIANFEGNRIRNKKSEKADACTVVKLYFQVPSIAKLDAAALASLKACEHLALSSNAIEKMVNLSGKISGRRRGWRRVEQGAHPRSC